MTPGPMPPRPTTPGPSRRRALRQLAPSAMAALAGPGCAPATAPLRRIGSHPWRGHGLMHLARQRQYVSGDVVRQVELPPASASLRALSAGTLEGADLTLDEVLSARARGLPLRVVAVGARRLFCSAEAPGLIVNVLAVRPEVVRAFEGVLWPDLAANRDGSARGRSKAPIPQRAAWRVFP